MTSPIATSQYEQQSPEETSSTARSTSRRFSHGPLVQAMISNNRLNNCRDVSTMLQECNASQSAENDHLCRTAAQYMNLCFQQNNESSSSIENSSAHDFSLRRS